MYYGIYPPLGGRFQVLYQDFGKSSLYSYRVRGYFQGHIKSGTLPISGD